MRGIASPCSSRGSCTHRAGAGSLFMSYGHAFVVLAAHVKVPALGRTGWALPVLFRLFEGPSAGGRADAPSDVPRRRSSAERPPRLTAARPNVRLGAARHPWTASNPSETSIGE